MTTPQKAAIEAISSGENQHGEYNGDMELLRQFVPIFKQALTTLRENQGCAVVTVEEFHQQADRYPDDGQMEWGEYIRRKYPNGLVIAPEKKEM